MILRRLRGIAGTALLWAIPWSLILALGGSLTALIMGVRVSPLRVFVEGLRTGFFWGLAAGALFGSALMLAEQKRGFEGLKRWRAVLFGAVAGVWFPALVGLAFGPGVARDLMAAWPAWVGAGLIGAVSGLSTVALANRGSSTLPGSPEPTRMLPVGDDP